MTSEKLGSFWDHVEELRKTIIAALLIIAIGFIACLTFSKTIITHLSPNEKKELMTESQVFYIRSNNNTEKDVYHTLNNQVLKPIITSSDVSQINDNTYLIPPKGFLEYRILQKSKNLVSLSPFEGLQTVLSISFWLGLVLTSPIWLYFIFRYIAPALTKQEKKIAYLFILSSVLLFFLGAFLGAFITLPLANHYFYFLNAEFSENLWSLSRYFSYSLMIILGNGLAFESFTVLFFLIHYHIISVEKMRSMRRPMVVLFFIISALLTPPDVISQLLLALPMWGAYELLLIYGKARYITHLSQLNY